MTFLAVIFRAFFRYPPCMWLVALFALHSNYFYVKSVFPYVRNLLVTVQTVSPVRPRLRVRLVAGIAIELHGRISRDLYLDRLVYC